MKKIKYFFIQNLVNLLLAFKISIKYLPFMYTNIDSREKYFYKPFFSPWEKDKEFLKEWKLVKTKTELDIESAYYIYFFCKEIKNIKGDFIELGVYKGGTSKILATYSKKYNRKLYLCDTFKGIPYKSKYDLYKIGSFSDNSVKIVQHFLGNYTNINYIAGKIPDTLKVINIKSFCFAHIDVDQYLSTLVSLKFIYNKMSCGGIIIIDDYGRPKTYGARIAVDEFLKNKVENVLCLSTGQGIIIKK